WNMAIVIAPASALPINVRTRSLMGVSRLCRQPLAQFAAEIVFHSNMTDCTAMNIGPKCRERDDKLSSRSQPLSAHDLFPKTGARFRALGMAALNLPASFAIRAA